jgi:hypothetical protein
VYGAWIKALARVGMTLVVEIEGARTWCHSGMGRYMESPVRGAAASSCPSAILPIHGLES